VLERVVIDREPNTVKHLHVDDGLDHASNK